MQFGVLGWGLVSIGLVMNLATPLYTTIQPFVAFGYFGIASTAFLEKPLELSGSSSITLVKSDVAF